MAPNGVKRRRLNPAGGKPHPNHQENASTARHRLDQPSQLDPKDEGSEEDASDDEVPSIPRGASYGMLLSSLKPSKSKPSKKGKSSQSSRSIEENCHQSVPSTALDDEELSDHEDIAEEEDAQNSEEEYEEGHPESVIQEADSDDEDDASDSFETHFASPEGNELSRRLEVIKAEKWSTQQENTGFGKQTLMSPVLDSESHISDSTLLSPQGMKLKQRLLTPALALMSSFDPVQCALAPSIHRYRDLLFCGRKPQNADSLRNLACLHALNHIFKTRDKVIKNSTKLSRRQVDDDLELRDQGFTRPKVLILLETRHACNKYMETITKLCDPEQQENRKRFQDAFIQTDGKLSEDRPLDFKELFEGNDDNDFRLGIKFTRKTIKYFSQFYSSDIIFASPLGLRRAIKADDPKKSDYDFLSSIEMIIVDQADAMLMQNWEHVEFVFEHLNLQPKEPHDCDFSRVRYWYLDQAARYLRQTIVLSAYLTPELNGLFSSHMHNVAGKVKLVPEYDGMIQDVGLPVRQTFSRFRSRSPASDPDDRFQYFITTVVPQITRNADHTGEGLGVLIFIPSYLDFARVRNHFSTSQETEKLTFGSLSEYTDLPSSRRGRSHFFTGKQSVMLYTGRAHHFRRYQLRGVKRVIFYGLPENPIFYTEIVKYLGSTIAEGSLDAGEASAKILFSRWDSLSLERIVGGKRFKRMLTESGGDTFEFR